MFEDLRDLYQEVIFDHNRNPRNFRVMDDANRINRIRMKLLLSWRKTPRKARIFLFALSCE